jgi:predicted RNase H-like HicB family nuclease
MTTEGLPARPFPSWIPWVAGLAACVITLVAGGALAGDWVARNVQLRELVTAIEGSEAAMAEVQDQISAAFETYAAKKNPTDADKDAFDATLSNISANGASSIALAGDKVAQVKLLPWDVDIWDSRQAYLDHNLAWQEYLSAAALDPIELTRDQPAIDDTFLEFERVISAAVPDPALFELDKRVAHLFIELVPEDSPQGPMQAAGLSLAA